MCVQVPLAPYLHQHSVFSIYFNHSSWYVVVLNSTSQISNNIGNHFICLFTVSFFQWNGHFLPIFIEFFDFLLSCKYSLYLMNLCLSSNILCKDLLFIYRLSSPFLIVFSIQLNFTQILNLQKLWDNKYCYFKLLCLG